MAEVSKAPPLCGHQGPGHQLTSQHVGTARGWFAEGRPPVLECLRDITSQFPDGGEAIFFTKLTPQQETELPVRMEKGYAALGVMEQHLAHHPFFVDGRFGLADIALYGYTHVAGEGGFNLDNFPHVNAWLARVAAQPGHVTIDHKN